MIQVSFAVLHHLDRGPPEDKRLSWSSAQEFLWPSQNPIHTRVGNYTESCFVTHILFIASGGSIVHADNAFCLIDLGAQAGVQQMTRAGDEDTTVAFGV